MQKKIPRLKMLNYILLIIFLFVQFQLIFAFVMYPALDPNFNSDGNTYFSYGRDCYLSPDGFDKVYSYNNWGIVVISYAAYSIFGESSFYFTRLFNIIIAAFLLYFMLKKLYWFKDQVLLFFLAISPSFMLYSNIFSKEILISFFLIVLVDLIKKKRILCVVLLLCLIYTLRFYLPLLIILPIGMYYIPNKYVHFIVILIGLFLGWKYLDFFNDLFLKMIMPSLSEMQRYGGSSISEWVSYPESLNELVLQMPLRLLVFLISPVNYDSVFHYIAAFFNIILFAYPIFKLIQKRRVVMHCKVSKLCIYMAICMILFFSMIASNDGVIWRQKVVISILLIYALLELPCCNKQIIY
ncbi:MAG: hypothetical protein HQK65_13505 [Desulfamplus sp.]|nr:hypothetical protein [Desulfamplus sp.]